MSYTSIYFLLFSLAVLIVYYIAGAINGKAQKYVLLVGSVAFYCIAGAKYLPFLGATLLTTFVGALLIDRVYQKADSALAACETLDQKKAVKKSTATKSKAVLLCSIAVPILLLVLCKYLEFFIRNINQVLQALGSSGKLDIIHLALPIGISFYTFMALSYILDIYWKRYKAEKNFFSYAAFLTYFPHIVQGPFDRYNKFYEQTKDGIAFDPDNIRKGVLLLLWGLFKKLVIADRIAILVDAVYDNYSDYYGIIIVLVTIAYSIQIYADFSGCIDIISGISECFGIQLAKNFNHPYFSRTMIEFWRRWHISLQEWFKDYIFFPVSMCGLVKKVKKSTRKKKTKHLGELFASCFPILIVWIVTGIWHGASWKYVAWGLFHAFLLISGKVFENTSAKINKTLKIKTESWGWSLFQMARTFTFSCIGRVCFRATSFMVSLQMFKSIVNKGLGLNFITLQSIYRMGLNVYNVIIMILSIIVLVVVDAISEKTDIREKLVKENGYIFRALIILIAAFVIVIFGIYGPGYNASNFIYQDF